VANPDEHETVIMVMMSGAWQAISMQTGLVEKKEMTTDIMKCKMRVEEC
jgi:hypothetical protein